MLELESLRKKSLLFFILATVVIAIGIGCLFFSFAIKSTVMSYIAFGIIILGVVGIIIANIFKINFIRKYQKTLVKDALSEVFTNLDYTPEIGLDSDYINQTSMVRMGNRFHSYGLLKGNYKDIPLQQADVIIEEVHRTIDSKGQSNEHRITLFKGKWMTFEFNKPFAHSLILRSKQFHNAQLHILDGLFGGDKFQNIQTENQEFNNKFDIIGQNQEEAFYILSPTLMEGITTLSDNTDGELLLGFINNQLHVALNQREDSFTHSVLKAVDATKDKEAIKQEITTITNFIDMLELDNKLFAQSTDDLLNQVQVEEAPQAQPVQEQVQPEPETVQEEPTIHHKKLVLNK